MRKLCYVLLVLVFVSLVLAGPSSPHGFFGDVKYSDGTGVDGVLVAKIGGVEVGRSDVVAGFYDLIVESENDGKVDFYLDGSSGVLGSFDFSAFEISEVDFVVGVVAPGGEDSGDDGGSSGGGGSGSSSGRGSSGRVTSFDSGDAVVLNGEDSVLGDSILLNESEEKEENFVSVITGAVGGVVGSAGGAVAVVFVLVVIGGFVVFRVRKKV